MNSRTVADAIEGIASQTPNLPEHLRVEIVGFDSEEALCARTDVQDVHIIPSAFGGGGKFFGIILGGLMIASAFLLPGIGIGLSAALKTSLIVSRSEEHTSELQSLMRISSAVFCLKKQIH